MTGGAVKIVMKTKNVRYKKKIVQDVETPITDWLGASLVFFALMYWMIFLLLV